MGVEQERDFKNFLSSPVDILQILQDDRDGLFVNRICHDSIVSPWVLIYRLLTKKKNKENKRELKDSDSLPIKI